MPTSKKYEGLGRRIRAYRESKGLKLLELAGAIGISHGTLSDIETEKTSPKAETIIKLFRNTDINPQWAFLGQEPMADPGWKDRFVEQLKNKIKQNEKNKPAHLYEGAFDEVDVYSQIGAGNLALNEEMHADPVGTILVPALVNREGMHYFEVVGDSMTPYVLKGACVGVDSNDKNIVEGQIYAVWFNPVGVSLKFIQVTGKEFVFYSGNRELYPDIVHSIEEVLDEHSGIRIIGRLRFLQQTY